MRDWKRLFVVSRRNALMSSHYGATYMKHHYGRDNVAYLSPQSLGWLLRAPSCFHFPQAADIFDMYLACLQILVIYIYM